MFIIGLIQSLKSILTNPLYMIVLFLTWLQISSFIGAFTYAFKYVEQQYGQSASETNMLFGKSHCLCLLDKQFYQIIEFQVTFSCEGNFIF